MDKRLLLITLFAALFSGAATGQGTGLVREAGTRNSTAEIRDRGTAFHLRGVLISQSGRSALINDRLTREGDTVAGAEILAIEEGSVRILVGSRELSVPVGARAFSGRLAGPAIQITRTRPQSQRPANLMVAEDRSDAKREAADIEAEFVPETRSHRVQRGETLASIAQRYRKGSTALEPFMMAVFDANPRAFNGNINLMFENALLQLPDAAAIGRHTRASARQDIRKHMAEWRNDSREPHRPPVSVAAGKHGPVQSGETLSAIALSVAPDGVTSNQMMMALYEANPGAFAGNINLLRKGAVLRIPGIDKILLTRPDAATAEVERHTSAWRDGRALQARVKPTVIPTAAVQPIQANPALH